MIGGTEKPKNPSKFAKRTVRYDEFHYKMSQTSNFSSGCGQLFCVNSFVWPLIIQLILMLSDNDNNNNNNNNNDCVVPEDIQAPTTERWLDN